MHKLRVFACIVERGSMTAAAEALGISRSVVSGHLKHLENDLGVRLVERTTRSMKVTTVGTQVYDRAKKMRDAGQAALDVVEAHLGTVGGLLRVAIPVDLGIAVLAPVVETLRVRHPALRIDALVGDSPVDLVREGIDVALRIGIPGDSSLIMRRLCKTPEFFVASPSLRRSADDVSALEQLPRIAHSVVENRRPMVRHPDGRTRTLTLVAPVISVSSSNLVRHFAIGGHGMATMPEILVRQDLRDGGLVRLAAPWIRRSVDVYALTPSRSTSPAVEAFLETVSGLLQVAEA